MGVDERNLPALHRLLDEKNHQYQILRDMYYANPKDGFNDALATDVRETIDELTYVLRQMQDDRIHISGHTVMVGMSVFLFVMSIAAVIVAFLN